MKSLIVLLSFITITSNSYSQWIRKEIGIFEHVDYWKVFFIDTTYGWIGGTWWNPFASHFVLRTTNGGENWSHTLINGQPLAIHFVNKDIQKHSSFPLVLKVHVQIILCDLPKTKSQ